MTLSFNNNFRIARLTSYLSHLREISKIFYNKYLHQLLITVLTKVNNFTDHLLIPLLLDTVYLDQDYRRTDFSVLKSLKEGLAHIMAGY